MADEVKDEAAARQAEHASLAERAAEHRAKAAVDGAAESKAEQPETGEPIFDARDVAVFYSDHRAVTDITVKLRKNQITALIGPSGCGKSTFIRCLNRMNDLIPTARVEGQVIYHDQDLYDSKIDPV
jgi:phosphate transport system ATP-binding protein